MRISVILKFNAADLLTNFVLPSVYAVTVISVIMAVAFFTVLERKVLAAVQRRRGPNMLGI